MLRLVTYYICCSALQRFSSPTCVNSLGQNRNQSKRGVRGLVWVVKETYPRGRGGVALACPALGVCVSARLCTTLVPKPEREANPYKNPPSCDMVRSILRCRINWDDKKLISFGERHALPPTNGCGFSPSPLPLPRGRALVIFHLTFAIDHGIMVHIYCSRNK